ncbi:MAG: heme exporter protein CcmD [Pseudomonadota bacterium]|jgi:heme exporter protein D|uniref:Heme exporter protein D n=1 Tax=Marisediminitalea aggregata TaxID=634436 RepID=A0A1M5LEF3_9ALTE|nr:heme exporter protein CcmD [Marisediminitalea aggregata]MBL53326.1 heme exporter protein CcmD [Alteromonadaceae bacterium]MCP3864286.1 heme exporter protein CcmD [Aestuariibacter sp.]MEC8227927.1 heme exporter protein CcmD [Pseudomonadota bacterium]MCP4237932.1 heme exporter protein CcmD [Aestuariibacter sp.]MCP4525803.1 heme exporter protein CcmD [Aestuariibacter sp.]|tara:strand:- start:407 stop:631 length:225 start_codon:yes stop_codon:yes gene_type:complete
MQFDSWQAFWHMGGYAFYVWASFGVTFLAMGLIVLNSMMTHKKLLKEVAQEAARQQRIATAKQATKQNLTGEEV